MSAPFEDELALLRERTRQYLASTSELRVAELTENRRVLEERAFYPAHASRKMSREYSRVQRALVIAEDQPCRICGVRRSTLRRVAANPYRATRMETHHCAIEWAAANAIDLARFQQTIVTSLAQLNPERYAKRTSTGVPQRARSGVVVARKFTRAEMLAWIDHDRDNLWVLCDVHHRHRWFGVHAISGPVWEAQRYLKDEFAGAVLKELSRPAARRRRTRRPPP